MTLDAKDWRDHAYAQAARYVARPLLSSNLPWSVWRATIDALAYFYRPPEGVAVAVQPIAGIRTRIARPVAPVARLVWVHGGAFTLCSPDSHARMTDILADQGIEVIAPTYRLAPEHPFPAGFEDCLAVARAIADEGPFVLGGDSAGGGIAAAVLACLLAEGRAPARVALISPATDFDTERPVPAGESDHILSPELMHRIAADYAPGWDHRDPRLSPIHARFPGCPRVLIHCSKGELLEGDTDKLAARMRADGAEVTVNKAEGLPHVWHMAAGSVPAADTALAEIAEFVKGG